MDSSELERALQTLGGGGGLLLLGIIDRPTADLDVVAVRDGGAFQAAHELPRPLLEAVADVASLLGLDSKWLNAEPADALRLGFPAGYEGRLVTRSFGPLRIQLAGRFEQICLKLHAWVDRHPAGEKHLADLRKLEPTPAELLAAARWARTHDPSPGFRMGLAAALGMLGVGGVDDAL